MSIIIPDEIKRCTFYNENNVIIKIYYDGVMHKYMTNINIVINQFIKIYVQSDDSQHHYNNNNNNNNNIYKEIGTGINNNHNQFLPLQRIDLYTLSRICCELKNFIFEIELSDKTDICHIIFFVIRLSNYCDFGSTLIIKNINGLVLDKNITSLCTKIINDKYNINMLQTDKFTNFVNYINLSSISTINLNFFDISTLYQFSLITKPINVNIYCVQHDTTSSQYDATLAQQIDTIIKIINDNDKIKIFLCIVPKYLQTITIEIYQKILYIRINEYYPRNTITYLINTLRHTKIKLIFSSNHSIDQIKTDICNNYIVMTNINYNEIQFCLSTKSMIPSVNNYVENHTINVCTIWTGMRN